MSSFTKARNNHGQFVSVKHRILGVGSLVAITLIPSIFFSMKEEELKLLSPRPNYSVVVVKASEPEPTPLPKHDVEYTTDQVVDYIWFRESTRGKNNFPGSLAHYCELRGKWNELGYGGMKLKICFKDKAEGFEKVGNWVNRHNKKFNLEIAKTLCWYNIGKETSKCEYGTTFMEKV